MIKTIRDKLYDEIMEADTIEEKQLLGAVWYAGITKEHKNRLKRLRRILKYFKNKHGFIKTKKYLEWQIIFLDTFLRD